MVPRISGRFSIGFLMALVTLLAVPQAAHAGQNTWTGSLPAGTAGAATLIAADPSNPYRVYAVFQPNLYRSDDGGKSWTLLRQFVNLVQALLVHPASPSTVYVAGDYFPGFFRSTDSGRSWTQVSSPITWFDYTSSLAGSPTDSRTLFLGTGGGEIYKSTDEGVTWAKSMLTGVNGAIASLVIDPRENKTVYAGAEADYYYFNFGAFARSDDSGTTFNAHNPSGTVGRVRALALDPATQSHLYMALTSRPELPSRLNGLYSSSDGGTNWSAMNAPAGISSLAVDADGATIYAGSPDGVYRSRDSGAHWLRYGLTPVDVYSLSLTSDGRFLRAGTSNGLHEYEIVNGPMDVAAGSSGDSHVLSWNADRPTLRTLDGSGQWSSAPNGEASETWTATAVAEGPDGRMRVLWTCVDSRWGIEIVGQFRREAVYVYTNTSRLAPIDISVGADNESRVLFGDATGNMYLARVDSSGLLSLGLAYGPAPGWTAVAIAQSPDGTWVLWWSTDGRAGLSLHGADTSMIRSFQWPANAELAVADLTVGADGRVRVLRTSSGGQMDISTVDAAGLLTSAQSYDNSGFTARKISSGSDSRTRVLWNSTDGHGSVWLLNSDNTLDSKHDTTTP